MKVRQKKRIIHQSSGRAVSATLSHKTSIVCDGGVITTAALFYSALQGDSQAEDSYVFHAGGKGRSFLGSQAVHPYSRQAAAVAPTFALRYALGYGGQAAGLSVFVPYIHQAALAQLVEHRYRKPRVVGSNPMGGSISIPNAHRPVVSAVEPFKSGQRLHSTHHVPCRWDSLLA